MPGDQAAFAVAQTVKRARSALVDAVAGRLQAAGGSGLRATHTQVFDHLDPDGTRLTVLAERAHMSHQAMSELVGELVGQGYLERVADPADGRARLIRPTPTGHRELSRAARYLHQIRAEWQRELGSTPVEEILAGLQALIRVCESGRPTDPAD